MNSTHLQKTIPLQNQSSQANNPLTNTAINNTNLAGITGQTVLQTVYQNPQQLPQTQVQTINISKTTQSLKRKRSNSFNKNLQNTNANINSQNNNMANTVVIPKGSNRASNTPNRLSNIQPDKNVAKTQIAQPVGKSKFNKTIIKDGRIISNIDVNNQTQSSTLSNISTNSKNIVNNQSVQSVHNSLPGSAQMQSQNQQLPTVSQKIMAPPSIIPSMHSQHQSIQNPQQSIQQQYLQSQKQSVQQSHHTPNQFINNPNASLQSQNPSVHQSHPTQNQSINNPNASLQSQKQSMHQSHQIQNQSIKNPNASLQSQKTPIQSMNLPNQNIIPSPNMQKQSLQSQQNQSLHQNQQTSIAQQNISMQPGSQIRKSNRESQNPNNMQPQQLSQSHLSRKASLKASRNKSPPQVVTSSDGHIKRTEKDNSGNNYYITIDDEKMVSDTYIAQNLNEYLSKEIQSSQIRDSVPANNKKGNGFRYNCQITKAGRNQDGKTKTDQDTPLVHLNVGSIAGFNLFGVLDGHGPHGHFVSQFCRDYFIRKMTNFAESCRQNKLTTPEQIYAELKNTKYKFIIDTFNKADTEISKQKSFDYNFSGTTCNIVFQFNKYLVCASVGDSRGILVEDKGDPNQSKIIELSTDHKPDLPGEIDRIHLRGGVVDKITDVFGGKVGPQRVWKAGCNYPGLAMSRSLGDFQAKECGVISSPQIVEYTLNRHSKYLIVCSDGVWEFITNEQVKDLADAYFKKNDISAFCTELVKFAVHSWEQFDIIRDDITVVCVYF